MQGLPRVKPQNFLYSQRLEAGINSNPAFRDQNVGGGESSDCEESQSHHSSSLLSVLLWSRFQIERIIVVVLVLHVTGLYTVLSIATLP